MSAYAPHHRLTRALTLALVAMTAACEQSTAPGTDGLDPAAALADYQALNQLLGSEGFDAVSGLGGRTPMSTGTLVAAMQDLPSLVQGRAGREYAVNLFRAAHQQARTSTFAKTVISTRHLGRTMVYSPALDRYVIDSARTGAPSNGVRFVAYEQDAGGKPVVGREIGYADLLDEGANTGPAIALRLKVVTRNVTTLDYRTTVDVSTTGGSIDVTGFATDGPARFDFTIGLDARKVGARTLLDADFQFAVPTRNFTINGTVRDVEEGRDGEGKITVTARHQENTLRSAVTGTAGTLDGTITWNGTTFVTISGPASNPTLRGRTGQPLTGDELLMVRNVMQLNDDVFDLVEELMEPVEDLVLLGTIL
ncbi:MAG: hypothetical protein JNJ98_06525 [Gemmatimonadetes bacterium]|nr:hypothetical protein [Gemmatimonadota bacterium]